MSTPQPRLSSVVQVLPLRVEDLDAVAKAHFDAFQGYMNTRLGTRYIRNFYEWFLRQPDAICLKGVVDTQFAGFAVGAPSSAGARRNRDLLATVFWSLLLRPHVLLDARVARALRSRARQFFARDGPETPGFSLVGIAVAADCRRHGVGAALLDTFERRACEQGHAVLKLSVYASNVDAIRLYERSGWLRAGESAAALVSYSKRLGAEATASIG